MSSVGNFRFDMVPRQLGECSLKKPFSQMGAESEEKARLKAEKEEKRQMEKALKMEMKLRKEAEKARKKVGCSTVKCIPLFAN